jgi:hypothetical protein
MYFSVMIRNIAYAIVVYLASTYLVVPAKAKECLAVSDGQNVSMRGKVRHVVLGNGGWYEIKLDVPLCSQWGKDDESIRIKGIAQDWNNKIVIVSGKIDCKDGCFYSPELGYRIKNIR